MRFFTHILLQVVKLKHKSSIVPRSLHKSLGVRHRGHSYVVRINSEHSIIMDYIPLYQECNTNTKFKVCSYITFKVESSSWNYILQTTMPCTSLQPDTKTLPLQNISNCMSAIYHHPQGEVMIDPGFSAYGQNAKECTMPISLCSVCTDQINHCNILS